MSGRVRNPERPKVLYHGTKARLLDGIMRDGLHSSQDASFREFGAGVYLTQDPGTARGYGETVLEIDLSSLDARRMMPDDHELRDFFDGEMEGSVADGLADVGYDPEEAPSGIHECSWLDSLRIVQQCQYVGDIPPSCIRTASRDAGMPDAINIAAIHEGAA